MIYNYSYNFCAFVIIVVSFWFLFSRKDMRRKTSRLFMGVLILEALSVILNIFSAYMNNLPYTANMTLRTVVDCLYLFSHSLTACLIGWYFCNFLGLRHDLKPVMIWLYYLPVLVLMIIPLSVPQLRRLVFHYTDGRYVRGPLIWWTIYLAGYGYCIFTVVLGFVHRKKLSREQESSMLLLILLSLGSIFVQQVFMPDQLINEFFVSIGIFLVLLAIDNQNWVFNFVTHTYNRMTFQRHLEADFANHSHFDVVVISISRSDYLKSLELDSAMFQSLMSQVANYLKSLKHRLSVYYCDSGTFALPVYSDSHWNTDSLVETLADRFRDVWKMPDFSWKFSVRITKVRVPEDAPSFIKLQEIIDIPYEGDNDDPEIISAADLLAETAAENSESDVPAQPELPEELALLLEDFTRHIQDLTPAEKGIVLNYLDGYEISEIPEIAGITINTVRKHNKNVYRKLQVSSKEELMLYLDLLDRCGMLEPVEKSLRESA